MTLTASKKDEASKTSGNGIRVRSLIALDAEIVGTGIDPENSTVLDIGRSESRQLWLC
jgi:hypothetical protein